MDFEADAKNLIGDLSKEVLDKVASLGQQQIELQQELKEAEDHAASIKKKLFQLTSVTIPEAMKEIGLKSFEMETGETLSVEHVIKASIANKNKEQAFEWLRLHKFGDLIKNQVVIQFDKGEDKAAMKLVTYADKQGFSSEVKESVHGNTLSAFVKEQMEAGNKLPLDILGVFEYDITKIKVPKTKKK
jgi:hypothetical protein